MVLGVTIFKHFRYFKYLQKEITCALLFKIAVFPFVTTYAMVSAISFLRANQSSEIWKMFFFNWCVYNKDIAY